MKSIIHDKCSIKVNFDTELQEFVEHEIAWEMLIQHNWNSLLTQTHLVQVFQYRIIGALAEKKINDLVKDGISVIYDTTSTSSKTRQLHLDVIEFTCIKYVIYISTDPEVCLNRVSLRRPASSIDFRKGIHRSSPNQIQPCTIM